MICKDRDERQVQHQNGIPKTKRDITNNSYTASFRTIEMGPIATRNDAQARRKTYRSPIALRIAAAGGYLPTFPLK